MHPLFFWIRLWIVFACFLLVNAVFTACRDIIWRFTGVHAGIKRLGAPGNTRLRAHRMKIRMKHILDILYPISLRNFLLTHKDFVDPEYVLSDRVTLLQVSKDTAIFIEGKVGMPPAFSMCYSFATIGQMATGEYIIVMPLNTFLHIADDLEDVGTRMVFLHNIARCGSSLVTNILEHTGRVVGWNEPRVLDNVCRQLHHAWNRRTSKRILRATLRMLAKPHSDFDLAASKYVIKPCSTLALHWRMIYEAVPGATHVFLYRDPNVAAHSLARITPFSALGLNSFLASLAKNPHALAVGIHLHGLGSRGFPDMAARYDYLLEWTYRSVLVNFRAFLEMQKSGVRIPAFKYEDLVSDPEGIIGALLKEVGLPASLTYRAVKAMDVDSQSQANISQARMADRKEAIDLAKLDPDFLTDLQQEFVEAGVPGPQDWKDGIRLPGTVCAQ